MKNIQESLTLKHAELASAQATVKRVNDEIAMLNAVEKHGGKATLMNLLAGEIEAEEPEPKPKPKQGKPGSFRDNVKTKDIEKD